LLFVSCFPAVGDLGQEFADVLDFGIGPGVNASTRDLYAIFWRRYFRKLNVSAKGDSCDSYLFSGFAGGVRFHSVSMLPIAWIQSQEIYVRMPQVLGAF